MSYVIRSGSNFTFHSTLDIEVVDTLPVGTYTAKYNEQRGEYYLQPIADFELPEKLYGETTVNGNRILDTFTSRPKSTGVLLNGVKGSGKTLLAKWIAIDGAKRGIPTVVVNKNYCGDVFNSFIQSIECPAIILFDEFEKLYTWEDQDKILTLFDGVYPSQKLFLLTSNNDRSINNLLKNRPGRIYYSLDFNCLETKFVREYCEDRLNNKEQIDEIVRYAEVFNFFNFDMLVALVEELNRYGESLSKVLTVMNIKPEMNPFESYTIRFVIPGEFNEVVTSKFTNFDPSSFYYALDIEDLSYSHTAEVGVDTPVCESTKGIAFAEELMKLPNDVLAELSKLVSNEQLIFSQADITKYDSTNKSFTYALGNNTFAFQLIVERNPEAPAVNMMPFLI